MLLRAFTQKNDHEKCSIRAAKTNYLLVFMSSLKVTSLQRHNELDFQAFLNVLVPKMSRTILLYLQLFAESRNNNNWKPAWRTNVIKAWSEVIIDTWSNYPEHQHDEAIVSHVWWEQHSYQLNGIHINSTKTEQKSIPEAMVKMQA